MQNSKWVKITTKEEVLKLKEDEKFEFTIPNLCKFFNVPSRRMGEVLRYYNIEIIKLSRNERITTEEWKKDCILKHNGYFDYTDSIYVDSKTPIIIGCPIHGKITVSPAQHRNGARCRRCSSKEKSAFKTLDKEIFKLDASVTHNNKYDYSKVEDYVDTHEEVTIGCPIHGDFKQKVYPHRYGSGCEKCSYVERGLNRRVTINEFKIRNSERYNSYYDYSKVVFDKVDDTVTIGCPHHGDFEQIAKNHFYGGCLACGKIYSAYSFKKDDNFIEISKTLPSGIYVLKFEDFYKIGISNSLHHRITLIKSRACIDYRPEIIVYKEMSLFDAVKYENILHDKYNHLEHKPEFNFEGQTECFNLSLPTQEIIDYLQTLTL